MIRTNNPQNHARHQVGLIVALIILSHEYSHSSHPRWKAAVGAAIAVGIFALPLYSYEGQETLADHKDIRRLRDPSSG